MAPECYNHDFFIIPHLSCQILQILAMERLRAVVDDSEVLGMIEKR